MKEKPIPRVRPVTWRPGRSHRAVEALLRTPAVDPAAETAAREVIDAVRARGDAAVADYAERFDGCRLRPREFRVPVAELRAAAASVDADFLAAARETLARVETFSRAGMRRDWSIPAPRGGRLGERFLPLRRVGLYIPGGAAPLASTVLMTAPLARVAGVPAVVACTPAGPDGAVDRHILCALHLAGVDEVYRIGGTQAIAAMALGTRAIPRVDKIVGPGGPYVAAAKRLVYGEVALDMVAGPSEIAILADASADPGHCAIDLLSQAEHGTGHERALFVTDHPPLARETARHLARLAGELPAGAGLRRVLAERMLLVCAPSLEDGMTLINRFAPEHLELLVRAPGRWLPRVTNAGAVFLGHWTPESAGDFAAGPSHVLPTGGTARYFSGLTVEDFRRRISVLRLTRADLAEMLPTIEAFGRVEGLAAHARSARARFRPA